MENLEDKIIVLERELLEAKREVISLKKIESNFDLLVNNMDDFVWILDKNLEFTYVSPSVKKVLGYSQAEFLKKHLFDFGTQGSEKIIANSLLERREGRASNEQKQWTTEIFHKSGIILWIESSTNPIINSKGEFDGILGVSRNVTQKKEIEKKIQENEANLIAQIDNTEDSIWSIDDAYCIKTLNTIFKNSFKQAFGSELETGSSILNALPEPFRTIWKERYDKALAGENYILTDHFEFEGLPQFVEVSFNPIYFGNKVIGVSVFSRNITQQKLAEQETMQANANLSSLIQHTDARIWSIDLDYCIISINSNFQKDFEQTYGIKLTKGSYALANLPDEMVAEWKYKYHRVLKGESFIITDEIVRNGVPRFYSISFNPIVVENTIIGATCYSREITDQKLAEIALQESENRYKSLVANIPSTSYSCLADKHWTMIFISNEIENLSGYKPDDFINNKHRTYASIIHPEDREYVELFVMEKLELKESFSIEYRVINKNNEIRWVHERGRGNFSADGVLNSIDGVISDITLRKNGEQKLLNSELKFRILSDASIDLMAMNSSKEVFTYIANVLSKRLNNTIILSVSINEEVLDTELVSITGIKNTIFNQALKLIGFNPIGAKFKLVQSLKEKFKANKLTKYEGGLGEFASGQFPESIANALQKMLGISAIYTYGITKDDSLLGAIHFFTLKSQEIEDVEFIDSFIHLSSILLHRQQLIEAVHKSEEKFRTIFENTNSAISIQTDTKILMVNKAWEKITGYSAEESLTLNPLDLVHPAEREKTSQMVHDRLKGKQAPTSYLFHLIDKRFNEKWIDLSATVIEFGGGKAILIIGSDITERKKAELDLNKFSTGIMNSPSSIVITDIDGNIEYVNPFFSEFTGYSFDEATGKNPRILNSGNNPPEIYTDMWNTILKGEVWNGELQNKKKNGQLYWESARIAPIMDESGVISSFIAIKEDITEQKRTLELIEQSEKDLRELNAKKDKFFSIIAHDLRSPFSGMSGLVEILRTSYRKYSNEQIDNYLTLISDASQNIFKLLENLLSWAKAQTGKIEFNPRHVVLKEIVDQTISVISLIAKNKEIHVENNVSEFEVVWADENMLTTILRNLISNSLKYTHRNGFIQIAFEKRTIHHKNFSVISIKDNGVGIPKDKQEKLFKIEQNYSTVGTEKEKGSGLGLVLCQEFVEKHDGKIWCESEENKGATFYFSLPIM